MKTPDTTSGLVRRLAALREAAGLSQRGLARRMGISHSHVSNVERGDRRLSIPMAYRWALACGSSLDEVLGEPGSSSVDRVGGLMALLDEETADLYLDIGRVLAIAPPVVRDSLRHQIRGMAEHLATMGGEE